MTVKPFPKAFALSSHPPANEGDGCLPSFFTIREKAGGAVSTHSNPCLSSTRRPAIHTFSLVTMANPFIRCFLASATQASSSALESPLPLLLPTTHRQ